MSTPGPLVVIGDALLDCDMDGEVSRLCPDAPVPVIEGAVPAWRPGGAALAALLAATEEIPVILVAPLGDDEASAAVRALLAPHVTVVSLPLTGQLAEKTRFRAGGRTLLRADRGGGAAGPAGRRGGRGDRRGRGSAGLRLRPRRHRRRVRPGRAEPSGSADSAGMGPASQGAGPVPRTRLATPNYAEALAAVGQPAAPGRHLLQSAAAAAGQLSRSWEANAVVVTLGEHGWVLVQGGAGPLVRAGAAAGGQRRLRGGRPLRRRRGGRTPARRPHLRGGDRRDSGRVVLSRGRRGQALLVARQNRRGDPAAAAAAVEPAGAPAGGRAGQDASELARRIRAAGGTVVATGGCFDLLHAGHVSLLQAARSLGDCLIVCLNADASVRRLKGDGRPLNCEADRVGMLAALECVDAVTVFAEDTPCTALERIQPDIWVKGGDYDGWDLPEAALLKNWGGVAVTVPYLSGRSTTRLHAASLDGADRA